MPNPETPSSEAPSVKDAPSMLKRYEILAHLASGGMADVFLARATAVGGFEKLFVIKKVREDKPRSKEAMREMLDEARLVAALQHANLIQVFDVDVDGETVFMVMEYLLGQDLRAVIRRAFAERGTGIPLAAAVGIVLGVLAGLHYAHERLGPDGRPLGIIHRDVSPQNVIVTYEGSVKVIDFGIAKARTSSGQTLFGMVKGKPGYMSPEQCRGEPLDRRTDVFCAAILLYELTTGQRPFPTNTTDAFFDAILTAEAPLPSQRVAGYPAELERIVRKGLARERGARYATAREMQRDLESFARGEHLDVSQFALAELMAGLFEDCSLLFRVAQQRGAAVVEQAVARATGSFRGDLHGTTLQDLHSELTRAGRADVLGLTTLESARPATSSSRARVVGFGAAVIIGGALTWGLAAPRARALTWGLATSPSSEPAPTFAPAASAQSAPMPAMASAQSPPTPAVVASALPPPPDSAITTASPPSAGAAPRRGAPASMAAGASAPSPTRAPAPPRHLNPPPSKGREPDLDAPLPR